MWWETQDAGQKRRQEGVCRVLEDTFLMQGSACRCRSCQSWVLVVDDKKS